MSLVRLRPADLRQALAGDGTSLQFQVQVHLPTRSLAGVEALVRWPHPLFGMVGPQEIVQVVEEGGLHVEFDEWVIAAACAQAAEWRREGVPLPLVAVNLFEPTLARRDLLQALTAAVERAGTPPDALELELPRGAAGRSEHVAMLGSLRTRGFRIATDAAAVEDLPSLEVDTIKLPYRLTAGITDPAAAETARAIAAAARGRGARLVAEGVETEDQQAGVLAAGWDIAQGYVFGPEVSAAEVSSLARRSG